MKKKLLLLPFIALLVYVGLSSNSGGPGTFGSNYTTAGCTGGGGCHTNSTTTAVTIELDSAGVPVTHYVAGQSYVVKITGINTLGTFVLPRFGFQLAAVNTAGTANAGTLATVGLPPSTHNVAVGAIRIFEQTTPIAATTGIGGAGSTYVESINWTAPATGFGTVKLNGSLNAVDFTGSTGGDQCKLATATLTEIVAPITGSVMTVCVGSTITLNDATTGGVWSSGATGIATVTSGGVVTGVAPGTAVISYVTAVGTATATVTVNPLPSGGTISGPTNVCVGASITLTDAGSVGTGVWSTTTPAITTVNAAGTVTGVGAGVGTIRYTASNSCGSNFATYNVTVDPLPNAGTISGPSGVCVSSTITLTDAATGGTWSVDLPAVATVDASGHVTGLTNGTAIVSYSVTNSCGTADAIHTVAVNPAPNAGTISGGSTVCRGSSLTLTDAGASGFGTWSSTNNSIATVTITTGIVHGVAVGADTIRFIVVNSCGSDTAFHPITVNPLPNAGVITGSSAVCVTSSITLTNTGSVGTGTWGTTTPAIATVDAAGIVTGIAAGTAFITFTATNGCGTVSTGPYTVLVQNPLTAGPLSGPSTVCQGATVSLTGVSPGGVWVSGNTLVATVNSSGIVGGVAAGATTITYVTSNSCGNDTAYMPMTVNPAPFSGVISGASTVCAGATSTLTTTGTAGGTWSSQFTAIATVTNISTTTTVSGVAAGTTNITYSVTNGCGTAFTIKAMTVNTIPSAGVITGATAVCVGAQITLGESATGGTWSCNPTTTATITSGGVLTGVLAGTTIVTYTVSNACGTNTANRTITVNPLPVPGTISGVSTFCAGTSVTLTTTGSGGSWGSGSPSIATVNSGTGVVTGLLGGTAVISYTATNGCGTLFAVHPVTVNPAASAGAITGSSFACLATGTTLSDAVGGGTWSINPTAIATIDASGVVFGVAIGSAIVTYTVTNSCGTATALYTMSVGTAPAVTPISGVSTLCEASSITLTDATGGGVWSSSDATVATVTGGLVTGTGGGTATISYAITTACGTAFATHDVTVNPLPNAGVITGTAILCQGSTATLTESATGGVWSSSPTTVATVNASGVVTGVSPGIVIIAYTVSNVCGTSVAAHTMSVSPLPATGTISGPTSQCEGTLITMTASLPGGVWSTSNGNATVSTGGIVTGVHYGLVAIYYSFTNACGTSSATLVDTVYPSSIVGGIVGDDTVCQGDTVHLSTAVPGGSWTATNGHAFVTLTGDIIGVTPGIDTIVYTLTNVCGTSTAMLRVTVRSAAACATGIVSANKVSGISVYPNPAEGIFTLELPETNEDATITIYDVLGKVVDMKVVENTVGSRTTFNLSSYATGSYIIKVNSGSQNFIEKVVIR